MDNVVFTPAATIAAAVEAEANELEEVLMRLLPQKKANQTDLGAKVARVEAARKPTDAAPRSSSASIASPASTSRPTACGRKLQAPDRRAGEAPAPGRPRRRRR